VRRGIHRAGPVHRRHGPHRPQAGGGGPRRHPCVHRPRRHQLRQGGGAHVDAGGLAPALRPPHPRGRRGAGDLRGPDPLARHRRTGHRQWRRRPHRPRPPPAGGPGLGRQGQARRYRPDSPLHLLQLLRHHEQRRARPHRLRRESLHRPGADAGPSRRRPPGQPRGAVGGGPGGMAAALLLDQAGFHTTLYEARDSLGGGLIASAAPPFKEKLLWYQDYLQRTLAGSAVNVQLGRAVGAEDIGRHNPQVVILAHGGRAIPLPIAGIDSDRVVDAYEILMGACIEFPPPDSHLPVMVYGGGETGCEMAELLAERGYRVILVSRSPAKQLARSAESIYRTVLLKRLTENPAIRILDNSTVESIDDEGQVMLTREGQGETLEVLRLLIAQGRRPDPQLAADL